jgi:hypothetical protein
MKVAMIVSNKRVGCWLKEMDHFLPIGQLVVIDFDAPFAVNAVWVCDSLEFHGQSRLWMVTAQHIEILGDL